MLQLYEHFIAKFESRLNQVKLAGLLSTISKSLAGEYHILVEYFCCERFGLPDPTLGIQFLERTLTNRARLGVEASLCIELDIVMFKLQLGLLDEAKNGLEAAKEVLNGVSSTESIVFSKFYKASAEYRKV